MSFTDYVKRLELTLHEAQQPKTKRHKEGVLRRVKSPFRKGSHLQSTVKRDLARAKWWLSNGNTEDK